MSGPEFIPCPEWAEKLASLHSHHLSPSDRAALEAHLASCQVCSAVLFECQKMDERIHRALSVKALPSFKPEQLRVLEEVHGPKGEQEALVTSVANQRSRLIRFITVQLIALVGWIIVQSVFSLSPLSHTIPLPVLLMVETIQWIATLVIMFVLFRREYNRFVQAIFELEETKKRLREAEKREARRNIRWGVALFDAMFDTGEQL